MTCFKSLRLSALRFVVAVGFATLISGNTAHAVSGYWNADVSGNWSNVGLWNGGFPFLAGDVATVGFNVLGSTASPTITIDSTPRTVGTLTLGVNATNRRYTIARSGSGTLTFDNNGSEAVLNHNDAFDIHSDDLISAPIILRDSLRINSDSTDGSLTLSGVISGLAGKSITNSGSFGVLVLSGANTFSGGVTSTGELHINNGGTSSTNSAIGTGMLTIAGGSIANSSGSQKTLATNNSQIWSGDFAFKGSSTLNLGTGPVSLTSSRTIQLLPTTINATLIVGGNITETAPGFKLTTDDPQSHTVGHGVLELNGTNTYTGGTIANGGLRFGTALSLPASGTLMIQSRGSVAVMGPYTTLAGWLGDARLSTASTGALALRSNSSEAFNPVNHPTLSLGSDNTSTISYSGTYTPNVNGYFVGGGGGNISFINSNVFTGNRSFTAGNGGGGSVFIESNHSLTGPVTISKGSLTIGSGGTMGSLGSPTSYTVHGTLSINRSDNQTISVPITGTGGMTKRGTGSLTLTDATYTGSTVVELGVLNFTSATTTFGSTTVGLAYGTATLNFAAGSTVNIGSGGGDELRIGESNGVTSTTGTVDASAAASLNVNVSRVEMGAVALIPSTTAIGIMKLALNNTITATTSFIVGNSQGTPSNLNSIVLGAGQNTINTPIFTFGERKSGGTLTMNDGGTLTLQGLNGGTTNLTIARHLANSTNSSPIVTVDLTAGTFIGKLGTVLVGYRDGTTITGASNSTTGTLRIGSSAGNNITMTGLQIGSATSAATGGGGNAVSGTVEFGGGTLVNSGSASIGINNSSATTTSAAGTFSISGGSVTNTGPILLSSLRGTAMLNLTGGSLSAGNGIVDTGGTSTLVLNGGSLNMNGTSIGAATQLIDTLTFASGSLRNVAQINNGTPLNKTTTGALTLAGTNAYTGGTIVSGGTLVAASSTAVGSGAVTVTGTAKILAIDGPTAVNLGGATGFAGLTIPTGNTLRLSEIGDRFTLAASGIFALGNITLDLSNAFNTPGNYTIIDSMTSGNALGTTTFINVDPGLNYNFSIINNDAVLAVTAIPEPSSLVFGSLLALGFATAGLRRRSSQKAN